MRKFLFSLLLIFFMANSFACINDGRHYITCEKTYISPNQVAFSQAGIFVFMADHWIQTEAVYSEQKGLFIMNYVTSCPDDYWWCFNCYKCVHVSYKRCPTCGK